MKLFGGITTQLGITALAGLVVGCGSMPDPYGGDRPLPVTMSGEVWAGSNTLANNQENGSLKPASALTPASHAAAVPASSTALNAAPGSVGIPTELIPAIPAPPGTSTSSSATAIAPAAGSGSPLAGSVAPPAAPPAAPAFTPDQAVMFALQNNPMLQSTRLQRGMAQGGVVIAKAYPYNPIIETLVLPDFGPAGAGIVNHVNFQSTVRLDLELRGQMRHRRSAADAVVTRTEWEIAAQELQVSIATTRAFNNVLYRNRKLEVLEDTVKLNELVVDMVKKLVDANRLRPPDRIVAQTELDTTHALRGQGKVALAVARGELRLQLGSMDNTFEVKGELDLPLPTTDQDTYVKAALDTRPDLRARKVAVEEAQARLRLQVADRFGNISFGPSYELDNTSVNYIGFALFSPVPVLNTHRGEIMQAQATVARSIADVKQIEIQSGQEVQTALYRLAEARKWADTYAHEVLPDLRKATQDMEKLFAQNDPGVDVIKLIDVQRNYLRAFDAYLDALFELSQARADLAAAVGDPSIALGLYAPQQPAPIPLPMPLPVPSK